MSTPLAAPIMVRNTQPGPTVFTAPGNGTHVEWQGADDPQGLDVQACPAEFLHLVAFRNAMERGIFERVEDEGLIEEKLTQHRQDWDQMQERRRNAGTDAIELEVNNDLLVLNCIAPIAKGGKLCDESLPMKAAEAREKPPLCKDHQRLAGKFMAEETGQLVDGKPEVRWMLPRMDARVKQQ
jgi:hypothetical protein